jgi:Tol biopolymer transport system component
LDAHFTADGQTAVYLTDVSGSNQFWKVGMDGNNPVQLTFFDDPVDLPRSLARRSAAAAVRQGSGRQRKPAAPI